jgi:O-antigen/teichoic acid export membrane protein
LFGAVALAIRPLLRLWLGGRFTEALPPNFRLMLLGALLSLAGVPAYYTMLGLGRARECAACVVALVAGNAATILAGLWWTGTVTVGLTAWAFVIGAGISTAYIRARCGGAVRPRLPRAAAPAATWEAGAC